MSFHRPNAVSCEVVTGSKLTPFIGTYLTPSTLDHLLDLEESLSHLRDYYSIVLRELNYKIGPAQNPRSQQVDDLLMEFGLVDLLCHFRQCWQFWHLKTC